MDDELSKRSSMVHRNSELSRLHAEIEELKHQIEIRDIALNATKIMIRITSAEGTNLYANSPKAVLGYTNEEREGQSTFDIIHPDDREAVMQFFFSNFSREDLEETPPIEYRIKHKDGYYLWAKAIGTVVKKAGRPPLGVVTIWDITQSKEMEDQLHALAERLHTIREEERTRISREIHDEFGQALTGLKFELAMLFKKIRPENKAATEKARALMASIDETIQLVRRISTDLRPPILDDFGLKDAIEWQTEDFEKKTGIATILTSTLTDDFILEKEKAISIFRIFQEALTNVARHSEASAVSIAIDYREGLFSLRIRDNGKGITEDEIRNKRSLGIMGMKERAFALRGIFNIQAASDGGTLVECSIPLRQERVE